MRKLVFFLNVIVVNYCLGQVSSDLKTKSIPVLSEKSGVVEIKQTSLSIGQKMVFVRIVPDYDEFEIIAEGSVSANSNGKTQIKLNLNKLKKLPTKTDYAVMLGEPKNFSIPKTEPNQVVVAIENDNVEEQEQGSILLFFPTNSGKLTASSSNLANSLKQVDALKTSGFGFE